MSGGEPNDVAAGLPRPGARLAGYVLERELGRGGMGTVYVGVNDAGMRRAIKVPLFSGERAPERAARFEREGRALAKLRPHANVLQVHGAGQDGPFTYCVLELIEGESLDRAIKRGPLEVARALEIAEGVARALAHVHAAGIIHRDVKPENVMIRADGSAVLADFGLARDEEEHERLTRTGTMLGTPTYMAPEQVKGRMDIDGRADVWALGVVLHEMLAGAGPFHGSSALEVLGKILEVDPEPLSVLRPGVPSDVDAIVSKALAKERFYRYATADALAEDIARARRGEPVSARHRGIGERIGRRVSRVQRSTRIALLAAALVAAVFLLGIPLRRLASTKREAEAASWRIELERVRNGVLEKTKPYRRARIGLEVEKGEPPRSEADAARLDALARDPAASATPEAERMLVQVRAEVEKACACARAEAALDRRDAARAREAVRSLGPDDDDRRLLEALADLASGNAAAARKALAALARGAKDAELRAEAGLGEARACVAAGETDAALGILDHLEVSLGREPASDAARNAAARLKEAAVLAKVKGPAGTKDLEALYRRFPRAFESPALAPFLIARANEALRRRDVHEALRALEMALRADPDAPPPPELSQALTQEVLRVRELKRGDELLRLWLVSVRAGFGADIRSDSDQLFAGGLEKWLRAHLADRANDWAARLLLSEWLLEHPRVGAVDDPVHDAREGAHLAREVADDRRVPAFVRPAVLALRGQHLLNLAGLASQRSGKGLGDGPELAEALVELERAIQAGYGRPDDCCVWVASALLRAGRWEDASRWAREGVRWADERHERTLRGTEALAEGRPPGLPLQPAAVVRRTRSVVARTILVDALIALGRADEALRVAEEFRAGHREGIFFRWIALRALAGKGDTAAADRLVEEELRDLTSDYRPLLAESLDNLGGHLERLQKPKEARWAFEKANAIRR